MRHRKRNRGSGSLEDDSVSSGRVRDEPMRQGIAEGIVYLRGAERMSFRFKAGSFEIPRLLPGNDKLEIQVLGYLNLSATVRVGEEEITLYLRTSLLV